MHLTVIVNANTVATYYYSLSSLAKMYPSMPVPTLSCVMYLLNCSCCVAEINAKHKQKELEESVAQSGHEYPSHHLCGDSLYDEIPANNKQVFATQQCPAYAPLPPPRV